MADEKVDGFITRSSSEQAEVNDEAARNHAGDAQAPASGAQSLTSSVGDADVVTDKDGNVVAAHTTTVIRDPESPLAVQVPDPDVYPQANATKQNTLGSAAEPSPNEVAAQDAKSSSKSKSDE